MYPSGITDLNWNYLNIPATFIFAVFARTSEGVWEE
jgi:hypothetical protein